MDIVSISGAAPPFFLESRRSPDRLTSRSASSRAAGRRRGESVKSVFSFGWGKENRCPYKVEPCWVDLATSLSQKIWDTATRL